MFFSYEIIKLAYDGLIKLDETTGKSRKEKVSGLRYLLATSKLLNKENADNLNLEVGSELRKKFIEAVGEIVAINNEGLYSKDFYKDFDTNIDYGVGSNFLTTRLANSRTQDINYPGRPSPLLLLKKEHISIIPNITKSLSELYGIDNIKAELSIWLLRNENFDIINEQVTNDELYSFIELKLSEQYTNDIFSSILPSKDELENFINNSNLTFFVSEKPDFSSLINELEIKDENNTQFISHVLINDLPDNDNVFTIVQQLLYRGAKGILFSGPPGTSKTWYALKIALKLIDGSENRIERVQFHPSFTYEDFIEGLVSTGSISSTDPLFKPKDKVFINICNRAREDKDNLYILIIDEFSRGDPSKIFGELLTYIEPDYREIKFRLPYSEKETSIPQNVIIFATMNPYDKSVVDLDSAMERRFDVVELLPNVNTLKSFLINQRIENDILGKVINFFNVANKLSPHGFGHTYFKGLNEEIDFILLWNHKLKFIFYKMFRFKEDSYKEVRGAFLNIISEDRKNEIS